MSENFPSTSKFLAAIKSSKLSYIGQIVDSPHNLSRQRDSREIVECRTPCARLSCFGSSHND